jgi:hypothetical protein
MIDFQPIRGGTGDPLKHSKLSPKNVGATVGAVFDWMGAICYLLFMSAKVMGFFLIANFFRRSRIIFPLRYAGGNRRQKDYGINTRQGRRLFHRAARAFCPCFASRKKRANPPKTFANLTEML